MKKGLASSLCVMMVLQVFQGMWNSQFAPLFPVYAANYDLAINKEVITPSPYTSGDTIAYRLTIENQWTVDFGSNITINDYLTDGAIFGGSWSSSEPSITLGSPTGQSTITWDLPFFFPSETITIDYSITMSSGGTMHNRSEILPGWTDPAESVPFATGTCTPGHNPLVGDYAVAGTNNVDCEEISVDGDPLTGACGTITEYYDLEGNGSSLTNSTPGLCDVGTVFAFFYGTHSWSWQCLGQYGGGNVSCNADELYCSDTIVQLSDGEQCDWWNQTNGDGCSSICLLEWPACALTPDSSESYINLPLWYTISNIDPSWEEMSALTYGDGESEPTLTAGNYSYSHTFQTGGAYITTLLLTNTLSTGTILTGTCQANVTVTYCSDSIPNGPEECDDGNFDNTDGCIDTCVYNVCGDGFQRISVEDCDDGNLNDNDACKNDCTDNVCGDGVEETGVEECDDGNGTNTDACTNACNDNVCGDGIVHSGVEDCDDMNGNPNDACKNDCSANICGDGVLETGVEECDDGNLTNGDGCTDACIIAFCGDGIVEPGSEDCDDANVNDNDACKTDCSFNVCGDSVIETGVEDCDDGNGINTDACKNDCSDNVCGDSVVESGVEDCDDGNGVNTDACKNDCSDNICGDSVVESGVEDCDDGNGINTDACKNDCSDNICGDSVVESGVEECDDGNGVNTDACTNACNDATCGDSIVRTGVEQCDDGNGTNTDACTNACNTAVCGDSIVRAWVETCDDGNGVNTDACTNACATAVCGDGIIRAGVEECDDSNATNTDACTNACTIAVCWDMIVQTWVEGCDDGNLNDNDACRNTCQVAWCGDGVVQSGTEECDDGNLVTTDACTNLCENAVCGDAIVRTGVEQCDDGNVTNTDACTNSCATAVCGDGVVRTGVEACDDGNVSNTDACTTTCATAVCGDGFTRTGVEQCDDANMSQNDACKNNCTNNVCGDAVIRTGVETCDDGNLIATDACTSSCLIAVCGDGFLRSGVETCDDANTVQDDGCGATCTFELPYCNLTIVSGEGNPPANVQIDENLATSKPWINITTLDWGDASAVENFPLFPINHIYTQTSAYYAQAEVINGLPWASLFNSCTVLVEIGVTCGNGVQETGEWCDDGNLIAGDGCTAICQAEWCTIPTAYNYDAQAIVDDGSCEYCGDGILQNDVGETCDDGNQNNGDSCTSDCYISAEILSTFNRGGTIGNGRYAGLFNKWITYRLIAYEEAQAPRKTRQPRSFTTQATTPKADIFTNLVERSLQEHSVAPVSAKSLIQSQLREYAQWKLVQQLFSM
jgi:cysteine-rich repeat protein